MLTVTSCVALNFHYKSENEESELNIRSFLHHLFKVKIFFICIHVKSVIHLTLRGFIVSVKEQWLSVFYLQVQFIQITLKEQFE